MTVFWGLPYTYTYTGTMKTDAANSFHTELLHRNLSSVE